MRPSAGFTLLELLIGAVVAAVLLAALYSVLNGVLGLQRSSRTALEKTLPQSAALAAIKRDLADMVAPGGLLGDVVLGEEKNANGVRSDTLTFCTASGYVDASAPYPAVQKVEYYLAQEEDGMPYGRVQLIRAVTRNLLATDSEETRTARSILTGVQAMEFEYYDGEVWAASWDSTTAEQPMPKAVRVRLTLDTADPDTLEYPQVELFCEVAAEAPEQATEEGAAA